MKQIVNFKYRLPRAEALQISEEKGIPFCEAYGNIRAPIDSTHALNGLPYKVGVHGFVFRWNDCEWVKSSTSPFELNSKGFLLAVDF